MLVTKKTKPSHSVMVFLIAHVKQHNLHADDALLFQNTPHNK